MFGERLRRTQAPRESRDRLRSAYETVPLSALGFPIAALVWSDAGQTTLSYLAAPHLAAGWGLTDQAARTAWDIDDIAAVVINR